MEKTIKEKIEEIVKNWFPDHPNKDRDVINMTTELTALFESDRKAYAKLMCEKIIDDMNSAYVADDIDLCQYLPKELLEGEGK